MKLYLLKDTKGAILLGVIVFTLIISALGMAMVSYYAASTATSIEMYNAMRSYYLAEGGGRFASAKLTISSSTDLTYTMQGSNDSFRIKTVSYTDPDNYLFFSQGITGNSSIMRKRFYEKTMATLGPNLCNQSSGYVSNSEAVKQDEACDGATGNDGYRSDRRDSDDNVGISYMGYDFGAGNAKQITFMELWHDDNRYSVSSVLPQYSDNGNTWSTADGPVSVGSHTVFTFSQQGAHRYWRILANSNTPNNNDYEWYINELEMREGGSSTFRSY